MAKIKLFIINQFFAQIGGEERQIIRQNFAWAR